MSEFTRARTRRHLLKLAAAGAASVPFVAWRASSAKANPGNDCKNKGTGPKCCFLKGTRISTPMGELAVEDLAIGDQVCTLDGIKTIKWIGYDKIESADAGAKDSRPIRIARFAIDEATPYRDLYLSPGHCLFLNNVLIPVMYLVNETSIDPHSELQTIEYYHVEFDTHEVIFAEGACVESYRGSRREMFANLAEFESIYGSKQQPDKTPYAPIMGYHGGRDELKALARSLISNVRDIRDPIQFTFDQIAERARILPI
jgi:hypothetical protein